MMSPLQTVWMRLRAVLRVAWGWLREVSGDNAYDLYLQRRRGKGGCDDLLSPQEFYCQRVERVYSRPSRCCYPTLERGRGEAQEVRSLDTFDPNDSLDSIERTGRDVFKLDLRKWQEFRHIIYVGNDASKLIPKSERPVSRELKIEYQTMAKSHYQSVSHLVCAFQALEIICRRYLSDLRGFTAYFRAQHEFYFHLGACFDGIARVAFILLTHGQKGRHKDMNWWDYAKMRKWDKSSNRYRFEAEFKEIGILSERYSVEEIYLIRNGVTHGWQIPCWIINNRPYWPEEIKTQRFLAWPYIESSEFKKYTWSHTIEEIATKHFNMANGFFNSAFAYLASKVPHWEARNQVEIAPV